MVYLAMTAAEFHSAEKLPERCAWMACHFSPYGTGLTNLPKELPEGSLLILNDRTPIRGHDPKRIRDNLREYIEKFQCAGLLLDLQRPGCKETEPIVEELLSLPYPVCVTESYGKSLDCPIFLPPVPLHLTPEEYLKPWLGREIWLDTALDGQVITVTESGSTHASLSLCEQQAYPHYDEELLCHYRVDVAPNTAQFTLSRTKADLDVLVAEAQKYGVTLTVGLWQEFVR